MTQARLLIAVIRHVSLARNKCHRLYHMFLDTILTSDTRVNGAHLATLPRLSHPVATRVDDRIPAVAHASPQGLPVEARKAMDEGMGHRPSPERSFLAFLPPQPPACPHCSKHLTSRRRSVDASLSIPTLSQMPTSPFDELHRPSDGPSGRAGGSFEHPSSPDDFPEASRFSP